MSQRSVHVAVPGTRAIEPRADLKPGPGESNHRPGPRPRSTWAIRVLLLYIVLLPVHSLIIAILLSHAGVPVRVLRVFAAWKEVLLFLTATGLVGAVVLRKELPRLVWVDWVALAWFVQVLLYLGLRNWFLSQSLGWETNLYGARDWMLYVIPYVIGRLIVASDLDLLTVFRVLLAVATVTSAVGLLEYFFVPTQWHLAIGIPRYFSEFLNLRYPSTWGLPNNYWQIVGYQLVRRAVSVHISGQGFAIPFLLLWPLCILNLRARWFRGAVLLVALNGAGVIFSLTRMTIFVCFLQGLMVLWMIGRRYLLLPYLAVTVIVAALFVADLVPLRLEKPEAAPPKAVTPFQRVPFNELVSNTARLNDSSSRARPGQWTAGWGVLREHPAGIGLGATGITAGRVGAGGMGNEAGYLKVAGALGVPGLLIFLGWFAGVIRASWAVWRAADAPWHNLAILAFATAIGSLINNVTAPPDQSLFIGYLFPWLAGMTVARWAQIRATTGRPGLAGRVAN